MGFRHTHIGTSRMLNHPFAPRNRLKEGKEQRINHLKGGLTVVLPFLTTCHHSDTGCIIGGSLDDLPFGHRLSANLSHHHLQDLPGCFSVFYSSTWNSLYIPYLFFLLISILLTRSNASVPHLNALNFCVIS